MTSVGGEPDDFILLKESVIHGYHVFKNIWTPRTSAKVYLEGVLLKRQRARKKHPHLRIKFQERFCRISQLSLKYYDLRGSLLKPSYYESPNGYFQVYRIRIVEKVPFDVFRMDFCFQVGDQNEVMYFAASSNEERETWMKELRQFATDNGNEMLEKFHSGVFARSLQSSWTCCRSTKRKSVGCQAATLGLQPARTTRFDGSHSQLQSHSESRYSALSDTTVTSSESGSTITDSTGSSTGTLTPTQSCTEPLPIPFSEQTMTDFDGDMRQQNTDRRISAITTETVDSGTVDETNSECNTLSIGSRQWDSSDSLMSPSTAKAYNYVTLHKLKDYRNKDDLYAFISNIPGAHSARPRTVAGHSSITETLLNPEAEFSFRGSTLHDLKSHSENSPIMGGDHFNLHSYTPFHSLHTSGSVTALAFPDDTHTLISASAKSSVQIWDVPAHTLEGIISTAGETSSLSTWGNFLAIGSNLIQLIDFSNEQERRILIADDVSLQNPPLQLVAFGPQGHLVTVNSECNTVKVWPPPSEVQEFLTEPVWSSGCILSSTKNFICSLSASTNEEQPWLVVGESVGCVHFLNWKEEEKTYHILFPENNRVGETSTAVSHCGENVAAGCGGCLVTWKINSRDILFVIPKHPGVQTISSLCYSPDDAHLAVGMSTGEVVVYDPWSDNPIFTLEGHQNGVSALAYSSSGNYFAAGYNNGRVQLWTTSHYENSSRIENTIFAYKIEHKSEETTKPTFCSDLPLIGRVEDEIQSREEEYIMEFLDYKIVVPANVIHEGKKIPFQTGEMPLGPVGPFKFPPNTRPVSSIVWLHSKKMSDLQKPIKIVLTHCLNCTNEDDLKRLVFVKAGDNFTTNTNGEREFYFHIVNDEEKEGEPLFTEDDGTLTTRYNCWYAICEQLFRESREEIDRACYCLTQAVTKHMIEERHKIRFILSYFLESCMEVIEKQYSGTHNVTHTPVTFTTQGPDPHLRVEFENFPPKGWIVACSSGQPIEVKDVYFLNKTQKELILALKYKQYPPNILLDADGGKAIEDTVLKVKFVGADKELKQEIILKKSNLVQVATPVDPVASLSHFQCTEGHEDIATGKHVYCYQPKQSIPSGTPQTATPQMFHTEYPSRHHSEHYSSSSPAQSTEIIPEVLPQEEVAEVPGPRNGDIVQD